MKNHTKVSAADEGPSTTSDFQWVVAVNRWLLIPLGLWPPQPDSNVIEKLLPDIMIIICYFLILFLLIPCALHTFLMETNIKKQMKMIGPMSFCIMAILKYFFLIMKRNKIGGCLEHMKFDWWKIDKLADRQIMMNDAKIGHFIASLCAGFMYSGAFFYRTVLPFAVPRKVLPNNITLRPLAYPVYRPLFNSQKTPIYEIVFTTQWFGGFVVYTITVCSCCLAAVFTLHACGQLKIVMSRLDEFIEYSLKAQLLNEKLGEIAELHLRAMQFINKIEELLNEICFVEFIGCTMNICFLGYYIITEFDNPTTIALITYAFLITSFTFNIFIYCHIGEILNQQWKKVGTTAYMINWYELPGKGASGLIILLAMSNCPTTITAGKMVVLSYSTFCDVLKTAMAYFNLLRSVIF